MFRSITTLTFGLGLIASLAFARPAAAEDVPFSADLIAVFAGPDREAFLFALEGDATQMGPVIGIARHEVRGPFELGVFFLEAVNGDTLVCSYAFLHDPVLSVGTYTVEFGTGRFENATGGGVLESDQTHLPGEPFPVRLEGTFRF